MFPAIATLQTLQKKSRRAASRRPGWKWRRGRAGAAARASGRQEATGSSQATGPDTRRTWPQGHRAPGQPPSPDAGPWPSRGPNAGRDLRKSRAECQVWCDPSSVAHTCGRGRATSSQRLGALLTSSLCPGLASGTTSPRPAHLEAGPQGPWEAGLQSLEGDPAPLLEGGKDGEGVSGGDARGAAAWLDPLLGPEAPLGEPAHEDPWMPPRALVRAAQRQPLSRGRESQMLPLEVPQPQPAPSAPPSETTQHLHTDAESKVLAGSVPSDLCASRFRMGWGGRGEASVSRTPLREGPPT